MEKILVLTVFACICAGMADDYGYGPPTYARTSLGDSIDVSTMKVLKAAYEDSADKNIVSSPLGLMTLLALYNLGAGLKTKSELNRFLGGNESQRTFESFKELNAQFSGMNPDYLTIANKVCVSNKLEWNDIFAEAARAYHSEFDKLDFTKPEEAADEINRWADEKTKGNIKSPVSKDLIRPDTAAALFNVIFFKGHWHVPFKAEETKDKDFHVSRDNVVKKPMMHLLQSLYYTESEALGAKMIELPYKERGFRMVVVLPNEIDGLSSVLEKVAEKGLLTDVFNLSPAGRDVDLDMPKFDIRTKLNFKNILPKLNVSKLFEEDAPGIVKNTHVKVSEAFQEAFIKVDEEGATAGAFTGIFAFPPSASFMPPEPLKFTVDHPFLYLVLFEDKIIFTGMILVPLSLNSTPPPPMKFTVDRPFLYAILYEDKLLFVGTYSA